MKRVIVLVAVVIMGVWAVGLSEKCNKPTDKCSANSECVERKRLGKFCSGLSGHACKFPIDCASLLCENGSCRDCKEDSECGRFDAYCGGGRCVTKSDMNGVCESTSQCSQRVFKLECSNNKCIEAGVIGLGKPCPSGIGCASGLYCDLKSQTCEGISLPGSGCTNDSDCTAGTICWCGKCCGKNIADCRNNLGHGGPFRCV
jgi:hypothetical protein